MDIEDILESTERAVNHAFKAIRYAIQNPEVYKNPKVEISMIYQWLFTDKQAKIMS